MSIIKGAIMKKKGAKYEKKRVPNMKKKGAK